MNRFISMGLALFIICMTNLIQAASPLVEPVWVKNNIGKEGIVFLDVSSNAKSFAKAHIPGAVFTHYKNDNWRITKNVNEKKVKGLLPDMLHLEKLIGGLGIGNDDHVIIIANGFSAGEMSTATRIYWTFKVIGHDNVSILSGGMSNYMSNKGFPIKSGASKPMAKSFKGELNTAVLATESDVKNATANNIKLIDSRSYEQFLGINKSGSVQHPGTLENAISLPGSWLTENSDNLFRNKQQLNKLFQFAGAPTTGDVITFCNTGHWASLGWFVSSELIGNKNTRLYDGSMAEWSINTANKMASKVEL
ncbi:MAG: sulfurtransferase [Gammaproteobacteria bacterium]|nr:sulfurtransferase [Gammaproteobacteria bacterium]